MVVSMTGFGRGKSSGQTGQYLCEIRSVNHRYSEIVVRMPKELNSLEDKVKTVIGSRVLRGRADVYISRDGLLPGKKRVLVDTDLASAYHRALMELQEAIGVSEKGAEISVAALAEFPEVLMVSADEADFDAIWSDMEEAVTAALAGLMRMREFEGRQLERDFAQRLDTVNRLAGSVAERAPQVVAEYRDRLIKRLEEILPEGTAVDEDRLTQELAYFADRSSIAEEIVRLESHIAQLRETLEDDGSVGRKIDFILQEMLREINTIGAKASDAQIGSEVVDLKVELEKMREQVQNIE